MTTTTLDRSRARALLCDLARRLRETPQGMLRLDDAEAEAARELHELLFGARVDPVQIVRAGMHDSLVFEDVDGVRRVRLAEGGAALADVVDLGDPLESARASIARLRSIAV